MPERKRIDELARRTESYLTDVLLPFWMERSPDPAYGGFLTYFDGGGNPTGETMKSFLSQVRLLYTFAGAHRAGYGGGRCRDLSEAAAGFLLDHYWDQDEGGWIWTAERDGRPLVQDKVGYGQVFGIYAFSEYFLATGDERGREAADRTFAVFQKHMADARHGGYIELMERDWRPKPPGPLGGDRKSLDVHMHAMEALTTYYEMTGHPTHRRRLLEVIDLIRSRMLHPDLGLGYIQFTYGFEPLGRIIFATEWGRDARPEGGAAPLDQTSPGHNVEFVWLLLHAADILGVPRSEYADVVRPNCDHCAEYGVDSQYGGVYADTPMTHAATATDKQFWQQPEVMIGMLDAYALFDDEKYWEAFENVYDFLFRKFINWDGGGEWYERLARDGSVVDDALGHAWKISYHSVRGMIQVVRRLRGLLA